MSNLDARLRKLEATNHSDPERASIMPPDVQAAADRLKEETPAWVMRILKGEPETEQVQQDRATVRAWQVEDYRRQGRDFEAEWAAGQIRVRAEIDEMMAPAVRREPEGQ